MLMEDQDRRIYATTIICPRFDKTLTICFHLLRTFSISSITFSQFLSSKQSLLPKYTTKNVFPSLLQLMCKGLSRLCFHDLHQRPHDFRGLILALDDRSYKLIYSDTTLQLLDNSNVHHPHTQRCAYPVYRDRPTNADMHILANTAQQRFNT